MIMRKRRKYQDKFLDELPNAIEAIVRGVRDRPAAQRFHACGGASDTKEPVKSEFGRVLDQQSGRLFHDRCRSRFCSSGCHCSEVNFFVVVISVQQQSGGNLSEALGNLARVLRNRKKMKEKVKAHVRRGQGFGRSLSDRFHIVVGILVSVVSPRLSPAALYHAGRTASCLGVGVLMLAAGIFVMQPHDPVRILGARRCPPSTISPAWIS
jgi:tight adherence protein B